MCRKHGKFLDFFWKLFIIEKGNIQPKKLEIKFLQMAKVCHKKTTDVTSCYVGGN
jgi:hypothetical protein